MKLRPQDFWSLGLDEWRWLCAAERGEAMRLDDLKALSALYPDTAKEAVIPCAQQHLSAAAQTRDPGATISAPAAMGPASAQQRFTLQRARDDAQLNSRETQ